MSRIAHNTTGVTFRLTFQDNSGSALDVSGASSITLRWQRSDGTAYSASGTLVNDGTDGLVEATAPAGATAKLGRLLWGGEAVISGSTYKSAILDAWVVPSLPV